MTTFTYTQVSPEMIGNMLVELKQTGNSVQQLSTAGPSGQWRIMGNGIIAMATYDGSNVLTVEILSKPFFIPESLIDVGIKKSLGR